MINFLRIYKLYSEKIETFDVSRLFLYNFYMLEVFWKLFENFKSCFQK